LFVEVAEPLYIYFLPGFGSEDRVRKKLCLNEFVNPYCVFLVKVV
jgi:hypothetical protein